MMMQDYEITSFFILAAMFELLERWRPAREIDRWRDLKIDVFAFALAVALKRVSHYSITRLAEDEAPVWLRGGLNSLQGLPTGVRSSWRSYASISPSTGCIARNTATTCWGACTPGTIPSSSSIGSRDSA